MIEQNTELKSSVRIGNDRPDNTRKREITKDSMLRQMIDCQSGENEK